MWGNMQSLSLEEIMNMVRTLRNMQGGFPERPEWAQRPVGAPWGNFDFGNRERLGRPEWAGRPEGQLRPEFQRGYSPQGMGPRPEGQVGPPSWAPEVAQRGYNWAQSGQAGPPPWAQAPETPRPMTPRPVTPPVTRPNYGRDNLPAQARRPEYL